MTHTRLFLPALISAGIVLTSVGLGPGRPIGTSAAPTLSPPTLSTTSTVPVATVRPGRDNGRSDGTDTGSGRPQLPLQPQVQQDPPNWGLARIDQRNLPLAHSFTHRATGAGVNIYVLDTGIDTDHPDFHGRAVFDASFVPNGGPGDCGKHGTVVAGIAGSTTYGVAKQATLHSVQVLDCNGVGQLPALIAGVQWTTQHAVHPAVAVLSWRYDQQGSQALTDAVTQLAASGVFVAASAGNTGQDSCNLAPRDAPDVLVVANSTIDDQRAPTSSTGDCVTLYAPGTHIISTVPGGAESYTGTSMAAPFAAGVAALYKQTYGDVSSAVIKSWMIREATPNVIQGGGVQGTPNLLLYSGGL